MHLSLKESLLPQPPSFAKKKHYEIQELLGEGTFGKVLVSSRSFLPRLVDMFVSLTMPSTASNMARPLLPALRSRTRRRGR
jgi:hypothetical protein